MVYQFNLITIDCFNDSKRKWHGMNARKRKSGNNQIEHLLGMTIVGEGKNMIDVAITTAKRVHKSNYKRSIRVVTEHSEHYGQTASEKLKNIKHG